MLIIHCYLFTCLNTCNRKPGSGFFYSIEGVVSPILSHFPPLPFPSLPFPSLPLSVDMGVRGEAMEKFLSLVTHVDKF
jgi:hypothetical protein